MSTSNPTSHKAVARWLFFVAGMVFIMVVIGGMTRLTESGLSMVEWRPLLGWLPPMSDAAWQELFEKYKQFPQYRKSFPNLDLAGFQNIFWLEYIHRVWGRLIGLAFALPFLWFLFRGRLTRGMVPHLVVLFLLGAAQGGLGWYMVASGLVDRPSVSQYRLTAHLGMAFLIYAYLLWFAIGLVRPRVPAAQSAAPAGFRLFAYLVFGLAVLTILSGGFVAGLDAGLIYNDFPLMGGSLVPSDYRNPDLSVWLNTFENRSAVQFHHRVLAVVTYLSMLACAAFGLRAGTPAPVRRAALLLAAVGTLQVGLGIATLLTYVPVSLGTMHQAGALLVITAAIWLAHTLRQPVRAVAA